MKAILFPTDFSTASEEVFHLVCPIAREQGAEIIVVHAVCPDNCDPDECVGDELDRDSSLFHDYWERFMQLRQYADDLSLSFKLKIGRPMETIVQIAREERCDMIAIAASFHTSIQSQYHRSIPDGLTRVAPCPVLCLNQTPLQKRSKRIIESLHGRHLFEECIFQS
jgi:nucleotide-binding universal stress UspA family protein